MYSVNIRSNVNGVNMNDAEQHAPQSGGEKRSGYHHGDLRRALIEAAVEEAGRGSLKDLSLRSLAARVKVSPAAVYRHFADLEALLAAAACEAFERFAADLQNGAQGGGNDPAGRLKAMGWAYLRFAEQEPGLYALMFGKTYSPSNPGLVEAAAQAFGQLTDGLAPLLPPEKAGQAREIAGHVWALVHGLADLRAKGLLRPDGNVFYGPFEQHADHALSGIIEALSAPVREG